MDRTSPKEISGPGKTVHPEFDVANVCFCVGSCVVALRWLAIDEFRLQNLILARTHSQVPQDDLPSCLLIACEHNREPFRDAPPHLPRVAE